MEEENEINESEFAQGFNWGYIIGEKEPELAHELKSGMQFTTSFDSGLFHGISQFFQEKEQSRINELNGSQVKSNNLERDI